MKGKLEILTLFVSLKITNTMEDIRYWLKILVFVSDSGQVRYSVIIL